MYPEEIGGPATGFSPLWICKRIHLFHFRIQTTRNMTVGQSTKIIIKPKKGRGTALCSSTWLRCSATQIDTCDGSCAFSAPKQCCGRRWRRWKTCSPATQQETAACGMMTLSDRSFCSSAVETRCCSLQQHGSRSGVFLTPLSRCCLRACSIRKTAPITSHPPICAEACGMA